MKLRYLFLAAVLFAGACSRPSETFSTGIIPVPQHVNWGEGTFRMPRTLTYVTDLEGQEKADLAAWMERSVAGRFFPVPFVEALEGDIPALRLRIALLIHHEGKTYTVIPISDEELEDLAEKEKALLNK